MSALSVLMLEPFLVLVFAPINTIAGRTLVDSDDENIPQNLNKKDLNLKASKTANHDNLNRNHF